MSVTVISLALKSKIQVQLYSISDNTYCFKGTLQKILVSVLQLRSILLSSRDVSIKSNVQIAFLQLVLVMISIQIIFERFIRQSKVDVIWSQVLASSEIFAKAESKLMHKCCFYRREFRNIAQDTLISIGTARVATLLLSHLHKGLLNFILWNTIYFEECFNCYVHSMKANWGCKHHRTPLDSFRMTQRVNKC